MAATKPQARPVRTYTVPAGYAIRFADGSKTVIDGRRR